MQNNVRLLVSVKFWPWLKAGSAVSFYRAVHLSFEIWMVLRNNFTAIIFFSLHEINHVTSAYNRSIYPLLY